MARSLCEESSNDEDFDELGVRPCEKLPQAFRMSGWTCS
jgi:hypothetical protein